MYKSRKIQKTGLFFLMGLLMLLLSACGSNESGTLPPSDEPQATQAPEATEAPEPTAVPEPTATEVPEPTEAPSPTPEPTATEEPTEVPSPTAEPTEVPSPTAEPTEEPSPTPEPTEEPFSLSELKTLEQVESINSYRLRFTIMATADDEAFASENIEMMISSALVKDPESLELTMEGTGLGRIEFLQIGDQDYANIGDGWEELPDGGVPPNFLDEVALITPKQVQENIEALEQVGSESLNGRETIHFTGDQESLVQILDEEGELDPNDLTEAQLDLWIDKADAFMVKLELTGWGQLDNDNPDLTGQVEMLIEFSDFNEEIVIEAPEIAAAEEESAEEGAESTDAAEESAEEGTESTEEGAESTEEGAEATEEGAESAEEGAESTEEGAEATEEGAESTEEGAESTEEGAESAEEGAESTGAASVTGNMACFGTFGFGISCLSESGWASFNKDDSPLGDNLIFDMALCPDSTLLIAHNFGISAFDGQNWTEYGQPWGSGSAEGIACDANGGIWVAHFKGVTYFDGQNWTTTPSSELATGDDASDSLRDVALGPDGQVWVATVHTIATTSDGSDWTIYQQGQGFEKQYFLNQLASDGQGGLWVAYNLGLLHFDGSNWTVHKNSNISTIQELAVDNEGLLWFGTTHDGLGTFDGQSWAAYDTSNSGLLSNHVRSVTIDAQGRFWLGTEWGLVIFDGTTWQTYQMNSAQLADNDIRTLAVVGDGPALPELIDQENGSLKGQLVNADQQPIANATVELCVESLSYYFTESPCEDQPLVLQTTTDADGNFAVTDMPVGRYVMSANITEEQWVELEDESGFGSRRILISPGEETDLSTLIFEPEEP